VPLPVRASWTNLTRRHMLSPVWCASSRYRQFNPTETICIVERAVTPGGRLQSLPLEPNLPYQVYGQLIQLNCVHCSH
jgi:hypothetical protein